ncbi:MAG: hypothetical protein HYS23_15920 [Geobacter sp.]|nr:hypothetical protein [Geobacter sp.]
MTGETMGPDRKLCAFAIVIAISSTAFIMNMLLFFNAFNDIRSWKPDADEYSAYVKRFDDVGRYLSQHETMSYISDVGLGLTLQGNKEYNYGFNLAQYALAPRILVSGASEKLIIGDFVDLTNIDKADDKVDVALVKDFGHGVILFEKKK